MSEAIAFAAGFLAAAIMLYFTTLAHNSPYRRGYRDALFDWTKEQVRQHEEAEPVVRCKDCRHDRNCDIQFSAQAGENFFCGAGERKEQTNDMG